MSLLFKRRTAGGRKGTLWCGPGNNAINESDLGQFNETDACCRTHDECKDYLLVGETKVNIQNNGVFTRSACTCDNEFYDCLKNVSNLISLKISVMYFNILQPQCFQCVCPTVDFNLEDGTEYKNQCEMYKWVDNRKVEFLSWLTILPDIQFWYNKGRSL